VNRPSDVQAEPRARLTEPATVDIMGMRVHALTESQTVDAVLEALDRGDGGWVITANLDHLRRFQSDPEYQAFCGAASLVVPDGNPLLWAARLQGTPLPGLVAGSNIIFSLCAAASKRGRSVFFLGGDPGTAERASQILAERFGIRVAGTFFPEFGFEKRPEIVEEMRSAVRSSGADIVLVALGSPKQERLIAQHRDLLPRGWWVGVGISFSFVCGETRRAPRWVQRIGMEWFHRLLHEPRRLFKRYIIQGLPFAARMFLHGLGRRFSRE